MGYKILTLLNGATGTGAGSTFHMQGNDKIHTAAVVIRGITIATVQIQVSVDGSTWTRPPVLDGATMGNISGNGVRVIGGNAPYLRANVTSYSVGTIFVHAVVHD